MRAAAVVGDAGDAPEREARSGPSPDDELEEEAADPNLHSILAGRYVLQERLGSGAMGTVYLAEHMILHKPVAIKVLSDDFAGEPEHRQRFLQEAQAASRIGHENIVEVFDVGETPRGSVFITMELLDGASLGEHLERRGRFEFARVRHIMIQVCLALGAAHLKRIVHRDVKPENLFLVDRRGDPDFVKVLDFGIAKCGASEGRRTGERLSISGNIFGTPDYMSPEQARGEPVDHRSDIYSAGCVLYHLLTGTVPFCAETAIGVINMQAYSPPTWPSLRAPEAEIAPEVEEVVMRALRKDPDERFQTMKDFSIALAACGGGNPMHGWSDALVPAVDRRRRSERLAPAESAPISVRAPTALNLHRPTSVPASAPAVVPAAAALRGRHTWWFAALAAIGVASALWAPRPRPNERLNVAPALQGSSATPPMEVGHEEPKVAVPAAAAMVSIRLLSNPTSAQVFEGDHSIGTTPMELLRAPGVAPIALVLRHANHGDSTIEIVPDRSGTYSFEFPATGWTAGAAAPTSAGPGTHPKAARTLRRTRSHRAGPTNGHELKPLPW